MARVERRVLLEYDEEFLALPPEEQKRIRELDKKKRKGGSSQAAQPESDELLDDTPINQDAARAATAKLMLEIAREQI